jgi:WD40 repeat protein
MLWNPLAPNQNLVQDLRQHQEGKEVECVDISSSGQLIATGGRDGAIMVSNMPVVSKFAARTEADAKASDKPKWGRPAGDPFCGGGLSYGLATIVCAVLAAVWARKMCGHCTAVLEVCRWQWWLSHWWWS